MSAAHLSTPPPPSAKRALATVVEDENKRVSAHTQRLGLLSPIPSFTSIPSISPSATNLPTPLPSSSVSSYSSESSSHQHTPRTPRTPLRSSTTPKPRPSPLLRLLQPFARASPGSLPTTPTASTSSLAHAPPMSQPPSPTMPTSPRSSSRSERLLRDALIRDDMERHPIPSSPLVTAHAINSPPSKGHRRRHSHIPTSTFSNVMPSSSPGRDEYTRGSFLFRTAMSNPRSPSPTFKHIYYGGDVEGSPPPTAMRKQMHNHSQSMSHQQSPTVKSRSQSPSTVGNLRSTSHSPSPLRRHRPVPLTLDSTSPSQAPNPSGLRRHHTVTADQRPQSRQGRVAPGEPLVMTPHEQVLRARLERVLSVGKAVERNEQDKENVWKAETRSVSRENEVRDEDGGWPWRERREVVDITATSTSSSPLYSAPSNNSGSSSNQSHNHPEHNMAPTARVPSNMRAVSHSRTRSKTDPIAPLSSMSPARGSPAPSPRRSSTAPAPSRIPKRRRSLVPRTGTTPPLVPGEDAEGEDGEDGDMRLLTPPPTPPFTSRVFSLSGAPQPANATDGYCPSPYKATYSPMKPLAPRTNPKSSQPLGTPRRPHNAPIPGPLFSSSDIEHEQDSSSCSSGNSQASFPASNTSSAYAHRQRSRSMDVKDDMENALHSSISRHRDQRPQFNARKASARCRAIEGYVSFASVEGLGEPPADPMSPDGADLERERGRSSGVLGAAWGGWKKLLNATGLEGYPAKDGGVVL